MKATSILTLVAALALAPAFGASEAGTGPRPDLVAKVAAGELAEAHATWWGFDEADSTDFLRAAISSGVRRLVVDNVGKPWVTKPLFAASNQEIVFERGVELVAKRGDFMGSEDCLLSLIGVSNVVLRGPGAVFRMWQEDYRHAPYGGGEYRHTLKIRGSDHIVVDGLRLTKSGGDGIYLGGRPSRDVTIRNVTCDHNHRQAISVIAADGLLIEDCVLRDTKGTPPESGIDFEPNNPQQSLKGIVVRRVLSENNAGRGFEFALGNHDDTTEPLDAVFEDCRVVGCRDSFGLSMRFNATHKENDPRMPKGGRLELRRCRFEKPERCGIVVVRKPFETIAMTVEDCVIEDAKEAPYVPAVNLVKHMYDNAPIDGIVFKNLIIKRSSHKQCDWLNSGETDWTGIGLRRFEGDVTIVDPSETRHVVLDDAWRRVAFPCADEATLPRVPFDPAKAVVVDRKPGESVRLSPIRIRNKGRCIFYAAKAGLVEIRLNYVVCNPSYVRRTRKRLQKPIEVKDMSGKTLATFPFEEGKEATVSFDAPSQGFYALEFDVKAQTAVFKSSNVPIALEITKRPQSMYRDRGEFYFAVPEKGRRFSFFAGGERLEQVHVKVFTPSGKKVLDEPELGGWARLQPAAADVEAGLWRVEASQSPTGACFEDYFFDLTGIPGMMFFSPEKYWISR